MPTILLVDDDIEDLQIFQEIISELYPDLDVLAAKDGIEGLNLINDEHPPYCIFLDLKMPRMNGVEFLKALQLHPRYSKIPTFIISSLYEAVDVSKIKNLGARDFFPKPQTFDEYKRLLDHCSIYHHKNQNEIN